MVCHFGRRFELVYGLLRKLLLSRPLGVVHGLLPSLGNRHDLVNRATGLGKGDGSILSQAVRRVFFGSDPRRQFCDHVAEGAVAVP